MSLRGYGGSMAVDGKRLHVTTWRPVPTLRPEDERDAALLATCAADPWNPAPVAVRADHHEENGRIREAAWLRRLAWYLGDLRTGPQKVFVTIGWRSHGEDPMSLSGHANVAPWESGVEPNRVVEFGDGSGTRAAVHVATVAQTATVGGCVQLYIDGVVVNPDCLTDRIRAERELTVGTPPLAVPPVVCNFLAGHAAKAADARVIGPDGRPVSV